MDKIPLKKYPCLKKILHFWREEALLTPEEAASAYASDEPRASWYQPGKEEKALIRNLHELFPERVLSNWL